MNQILTEDDVLALIIQKCTVHGVAAMARRLGVSQAYLINIRQRRVGIGPKILTAMGMEPVYRMTDAGAVLWR